MTESPLVDEISILETVSKGFAIVAGVFYLTGFLVVAFHVSRYGVSSFDVLQLQYLIAGIWTLGPPLLLGSFFHIERRFSDRAAPPVEGRFNWRRFGISSLFSTVPFSVFLILLAMVPNVIDNLTWGIGLRLYVFFIAMVSCAQLFWLSRRSDPAREHWLMNRSHAAPFYLSALFVLVLGYALWFSARIYPLIPFALGGGKPLTVVFFEGEKRMPDEIQKAALSDKRSVPYKLLLATDKYYVVMSPSVKERSLEISRDAVAGMIVLDAN